MPGQQEGGEQNVPAGEAHAGEGVAGEADGDALDGEDAEADQDRIEVPQREMARTPGVGKIVCAERAGWKQRGEVGRSGGGESDGGDRHPGEGDGPEQRGGGGQEQRQDDRCWKKV